MKLKDGMIAFALIAIACPAFAATDGALDMVSSVGTYTNTFGATVPNGRKIQVSGLLDAAVLNTTPSLPYQGDTTMVGIRDSFCVTDNAGGNVRLKLGVVNGYNGFYALNQAGEYLAYYITLGLGAAAPVAIGLGATVDVLAAPTDKSKCGTGNVTKGVHIPPTIPTNKTYVSTIIITATPL